MSVPVLSWSLIGGRTEKDPLRGLPQSNENPRRAVNWTGFAPRDLPRPAGGHTRFLLKARPPRPSEPILIPKLRIQFADFPYLHYSNRVHTQSQSAVQTSTGNCAVPSADTSAGGQMPQQIRREPVKRGRLHPVGFGQIQSDNLEKSRCGGPLYILVI